MLLEKRIPATYVLKKVRFDLAYVLFVSLSVHSVTYFFHGFLPSMPLNVPAFIGTAISILLSFKISQSYDRWWEARKVWGSIVHDSRSLVLQLKSFVASGHEEAVRKIALRQIAWCYCLGQTLRGLPAAERIKHLISEDEAEEIASHSNKPLALLSRHAQDLGRLRKDQALELFSQVQMDNTLVRLCDAQGRAERIKSTVFPKTYRIFLHGIIYLFVVTLSLSLKDVPLQFELPLLLSISAPFFMLEKSARHMQDPFENRPTDISVNAIARTIEINIRQILQDDQVPEPWQPDGFYLS